MPGPLLREGIPDRGEAGHQRTIEGDWPYLCIDATFVKARVPGRVVSVAVIVAVGVTGDGRHQVPGMNFGPSEAEIPDQVRDRLFWTGFPRKPVRRALGGVELVIADRQAGIEAAVTEALDGSGQRCRVHFTNNVLAHAGRDGRRVVSGFVVSGFVVSAFAQNDTESASRQRRLVTDHLRPNPPWPATPTNEAETDVLADRMALPQHRATLRSTNPLERVNGGLTRHTEVVGIVPGEPAITRLTAAILLAWDDQSSVEGARSMTPGNHRFPER